MASHVQPAVAMIVAMGTICVCAMDAEAGFHDAMMIAVPSSDTPRAPSNVLTVDKPSIWCPSLLDAPPVMTGVGACSFSSV
ncbi:hypothetical protein E2C01_042048 [Portunus trituberculatus]|uniref:Uncharacterized protein n=1 Tax=Portunus trituberculatus TaxID=210409 RepID=A0A5B7FLH5_PORTR|nr:hypothetical protein [Portunus trituberculatus]